VPPGRNLTEATRSEGLGADGVATLSLAAPSKQVFAGSHNPGGWDLRPCSRARARQADHARPVGSEHELSLVVATGSLCFLDLCSQPKRGR
jgi:hypothetical protein